MNYLINPYNLVKIQLKTMNLLFKIYENTGNSIEIELNILLN